MSRTDTERLDWLERICNRDATPRRAPYITGSKRGYIIWDQIEGLEMMGRGPTLRDAIDAAASREEDTP